MKTVEEIERITLAVMKKVAKEEFGDDFDVDDPVDPDDMRFMVKVMSGVLAAVDSERGKDAVGWMWQHEDTGNIGVVDQWQIDNGWEEGNPRIHIIGPVFLSPTNQLGFALVPIDPSEEWIAKVVRVNQPDLAIGCRAWREEVEYLEYWHKAMIQAAGVTK